MAAIDYDNSNVNYRAKDGYDGSLSDRAVLVNGGGLKFTTTTFNIFKIATVGYLQTLHNIDRILLGVELAPVQLPNETAQIFNKRTY